MKTLPLVFIWIFTFNIGNYLYSQDYYFWAGMKGDEKIDLNLDPLRMLYRLENLNEAPQIINKIKTEQPKLSPELMKMSSATFLLIRRNNTSTDFPKISGIKFQIPVYTTKRTAFAYSLTA